MAALIDKARGWQSQIIELRRRLMDKPRNRLPGTVRSGAEPGRGSGAMRRAFNASRRSRYPGVVIGSRGQICSHNCQLPGLPPVV